MTTFRHRTTILITGPTQAGKTFFFNQIIENSLIQPSPSHHISLNLTCNLADLKHLYPTIKDVQCMKSFLEILPMIYADERTLDDQITEAGKLEETTNLLTQGSHRRNITVVNIVQNVFDNGKVHRTISLNSHYMVLFKNHGDEGQMRSPAKQVFPTKVKFFMDSHREATKKDHGHFHHLTLILEGRAPVFSAFNYHSIGYVLTSVKKF